MNQSTNKLPVWFWIVGVVALLWNLMGLFAFYADMTISESALAAMDAAQRNLYETQALWAKVAFGGAVILGTLGSLGLLMRKRWARPVLVVSLVCVLVQMANSFMTNAYEIMGSGSMVMGSIVLLIAAFLVWFARATTLRGYLN